MSQRDENVPRPSSNAARLPNFAAGRPSFATRKSGRPGVLQPRPGIGPNGSVMSSDSVPGMGTPQASPTAKKKTTLENGSISPQQQRKRSFSETQGPPTTGSLVLARAKFRATATRPVTIGCREGQKIPGPAGALNDIGGGAGDGMEGLRISHSDRDGGTGTPLHGMTRHRMGISGATTTARNPRRTPQGSKSMLDAQTQGAVDEGSSLPPLNADLAGPARKRKDNPKFAITSAWVRLLERMEARRQAAGQPALDLSSDVLEGRSLPDCHAFRYNLGLLRRKQFKVKVPQLHVAVNDLTVDDGGDISAMFTDPTGYMQASIHRKAVEKAPFLSVGSVVSLKNVSIFSPGAGKMYLNVTVDNIEDYFPSDQTEEEAPPLSQMVSQSQVPRLQLSDSSQNDAFSSQNEGSEDPSQQQHQNHVTVALHNDKKSGNSPIQRETRYGDRSNVARAHTKSNPPNTQPQGTEAMTKILSATSVKKLSPTKDFQPKSLLGKFHKQPSAFIAQQDRQPQPPPATAQVDDVFWDDLDETILSQIP
eukprot:Clim_evm43s151 gene=Clim_evmTU43s151